MSRDVVAAIEAAFRDVPYPGDKRVKGGDDIILELMDVGGYIGRDLRGRHWRDIPIDVLRFHSWHTSLTFMTPDVFHFYLPAFLIGSLSDDEIQEHTCNALTPPGPGEQRFSKLFDEPIAQLDRAQRETIGMFWRFLCDRGDLSGADAERALAFWSTYLPLSS